MCRKMRRVRGVQFLDLVVIAILLQCVLVKASADFSRRPFSPGIANAEEYNVVHPVRLDSMGKFLTHDLHFTKEVHIKHRNTRRKRHVDEEHSAERTSRLLYSIPYGDHLITLNLTENEELVPRDFMIERIRGSNKSSGEPFTSSLTRGTRWPCYFRGHVEGEPSSRVALSTCHGLTGLIITEGGEFFLEPAEPHRDGREASRAQAHKMYRRDVSTILDKAEPLLHLEKLAEDDKRARSRHIQMAEESEGEVVLEERPYPDSLFFGQSSKEFCGVLDTNRRYRHIIRRREQWEKRHHGREKRKTEHTKRRSKRSVSVERMIEMLVVADKTMVDYYEANENGGIEKYVLTIVNMVSTLFKDPSIGNFLHVSLVRLILIEDEEKGPNITSDAENTLDAFCKWAKKINPPEDDHPNHHDVAVLLTRREICSQSNKSCETLGLAHVAGMCQSHRSCSLNQDVGLSLAYTVTHELGHNFAMHHDGQANDCKPNSRYNQVMAPHLTSSKLPMRWSSCSRKYITRFLDRNWGFCLNDKPADHPEFPPTSALPGVIYDADHQCRLKFGEKSKYCHGINDMCDRLWCYVDGTCRTRLHAAVPGTKCGKNKWCIGGKCVSTRRQPTPVNGGWGMWSKWTVCSRTCGIGVSSSIRHCDNPVPEEGGSYCIGERKRYKTCSKWRCREDEGAPSFKGQQCSEYNDVLYKNKTFTWEPVESALYPCELHCFTHSGKFYFADRMRDRVVDGTQCFPGSDDICVDGICRRIGCDRNIGSMALEDRCGVCHGNGSACYEVKKVFSRKRGEEYTPAGLLPVGARNVEIIEVESSSNFLALRHATNKTHYYLNGNYMIQWDNIFQLAGTQFSYRRENETRDIITASGPLTEAIMIMVLFVEENPGISIEYTMPHDINFNPTRELDYPEFNWLVRGWTECTTECGTGSQELDIVCAERVAGVVEDFFCNATERPPDEQRSCNETPCPARWWTSRWDSCSVTCGTRPGTQQRRATCVRSVGEKDRLMLNDTDCASSERPVERRKCRAVGQVPCPTWRTGDWQECSRSCGGGIKNRTVQCVTLIIDDVIVGDGDAHIEEIDISDIDIGNVPPKPRKTRKPTGSKHDNPPDDEKQENLLRATGVLLSIEAEPIELELDPDGYNIEEDDLCDPDIRPASQKVCKVGVCPTTTIVSSVEPVTSSSGLTTTENEISNEILHDDPAEVATENGGEYDSGSSSHETGDDSSDVVSESHIPATETEQDLPEPAGILSGHDNAVNSDENTELAGMLNGSHKGDEDFPFTSPEIPTDISDVASADNTPSSSDNDVTTSEHDVTTPEKDEKVIPDLIKVTESEKNVATIHHNENALTNTDTSGRTEISSPEESPVGRSVINSEDEDVEEASVVVTYSGAPHKRETSSTAPTEQITSTSSRAVEQKTKEFDVGDSFHDTDGVAPEPDKTGDSGFAIPDALLDATLDDGDDNLFDVNDDFIGEPMEPDHRQKSVVPELRNVDLDFDVKIVKNGVTSKTSTTEVKTSTTTATTTTKSTTTKAKVDEHKTVGTTEKPIKFDTEKPTTTQQTTTPSIEGEWIVGEWSKCSVTCGVGAKIRQVRCSVENEKLCNESDRPAPAILCNSRPCAKWVYGEWTQCSTSCGTGTHTKTIECADERTGKFLRPHHCRHLPTLAPVKVSCQQNNCLRWRTSRWTSCSEPCGSGSQRRRVVCPHKGQCDQSLKPQHEKGCFSRVCVDWKPLKWNKCSVHCGGGIRRRQVICIERESGIRTNTSLCQPGLRPSRVERCNQRQCPVTDYDFSNCHANRLSSTFCTLLEKMGRCVQPSLAIQCCVTCETYLKVRHKDKIS